MRIYTPLLFLLIVGSSAAQVPDKSPALDSLRITYRDTIQQPVTELTYKVSPDSLEAKVEYGANDSMRFDNSRSEWHLYGDATVKYLTLTLMADYIVFSLDSNIAYASGLPDSLGDLAGYPVFSDGQNQPINARQMKYNFKSRKGVILQSSTQQGDLYIHGERTKYIGGSTTDTTQADDEIYNAGALITNCDAPEPHWGIRSSKIKAIPNKLAVVGASNVEIQGVPTPLWLPFGFFPVSPSRRSGLIFPRDYEFSDTWGFGLRDLGYYIPINEHIDARILGDIYFNGSWGLQLQSSYKKRYAYNGNINLGYSNRRAEIPGDFRIQSQKSYSIRVSHNQDTKAHPYRRFGGSINIQTNDYQSLNENDANSVLTSLYSSNFSWSRTFPGKPYSVSVGLSHSQNTRTKEVTIDAPVVDFRLNRIYPFKIKNRVGKEKWFEKIGFQYSGNARSKFLTTEDQLFTDTMWQSALYGVQHRANADLNFNALKYFNFTPNVNYEETWFFRTKEREFVFDPATDIVLDTLIGPGGEMIITPDTISYGSFEDNVMSGFVPFRRFSSGISMNTQIYGTAFQFDKGWLRGVRHVIKPAFAFSYSPDLYGNLVDSVQYDIRRPNDLIEYSILDRGVYSASFTRGEQMLLSYSFNNIFEAKYFSKKDSTEKKLKIFDNIVVGGNYNFAALGDSLHFSPLNINGTTRFFKGASTFGFSAMYDFYEINAQGRRYDKLYWKTPGHFLRFENFQARLATRLTIQKIRDLFTGKESATTSSSPASGARATGRDASDSPRGAREPDKFFDLFNDFSIDHNLGIVRDGRRDTTMVTTHTINVRGSLHISPKWTINVGNIGYDFRSDRLTYPDFGFSRDLHCWFLALSWQPQRGTYSLQIGVKPGSLDFLKIPHNRNQQDTFGGF